MIGETLNPSSLNLVQLNDQVYSLLKEEIFRGNLPPGQRLSLGVHAELRRFEALGRVFNALGQYIADAFALRHKTQYRDEGLPVAEAQFDAARVFERDYSLLETLHGKRYASAGVHRVHAVRVANPGRFHK